MKTTLHTNLKAAKFFLLLVLLLIAVLPAHAYDFMVDSIAYNFNSNDSTTVSVAPISNTEYYKGDIVIPETVIYSGSSLTVTAIGQSAFTFCSEMTSIQLPGTIKKIEPGAFMNCYGLTTIDLPEDLESIGNLAFVACENLESVTIPTSVKDIGYMAFHLNFKLRNVTIPEGIEIIRYKTFNECYALKDVKLPQSLKYIQHEAFNECKELSTVVIPDSVVEIGDRAFNDCRNVTEVNIGKNVKHISSTAFANCEKIEVLKWNAQECDDFDENYTSPFMPYVTRVSLIIGNDVKRIPARAFRYSIPLKSIDIPASVKEIGNNAFDTCFCLNTIVSRILEPSLVTYGNDIESIFNGVDKDSCVVFVPAGTIEEYKAIMPWSAFTHFEEIVENDINCDMAVTSADVTMLYNQILNNDYSSPSTCDVNGDGEVTSADVTAIYNTILGNE